MKAVGELIIVVPVNPELLERDKDSRGFGVKNAKKTWSLQWRVVSVGYGDTIPSNKAEAGYVYRPLAFQVGDVILRRADDEACREEWEKEIFMFRGERAMSIIGRMSGTTDCGHVLALVSRNGVEVND